MEITDYSKEYEETLSVGKHSALFPTNIFCVIAGAAGCRKTMFLPNLPAKPDILHFADLYIYCPNLYQKAYKNLKKHFEEQEKALNDDKPICAIAFVAMNLDAVGI